MVAQNAAFRVRVGQRFLVYPIYDSVPKLTASVGAAFHFRHQSVAEGVAAQINSLELGNTHAVAEPVKTVSGERNQRGH